MKKSLLLIAASYFEHYPKQSEIFFTKDEQAFFVENDATNHGKSLRAKESDEVEVTKITREEAEAEKADDTPAPATKEDVQAKVDDAQADVDAATVAYDEAKAKLDEKPDNKNYQKSEASRKAKLEAAQTALDNAKKELAAFGE